MMKSQRLKSQFSRRKPIETDIELEGGVEMATSKEGNRSGTALGTGGWEWDALSIMTVGL